VIGTAETHQQVIKLATELRALVAEVQKADDDRQKLAMLVAAGSLGHVLAGKILESEGLL
jgi:isopentenyl phosphate kinase